MDLSTDCGLIGYPAYTFLSGSLGETRLCEQLAPDSDDHQYSPVLATVLK